MFEIYTIGEMEFIHEVMHGIARLFNSNNGVIWPFITLMGVLSLFYNFLMLPTKDKPSDPIKSFITGILITYILMGPDTQVDVVITDTSTQQQLVVSGVPFILGFGGQLSTGLTYEFNEVLKDSFSSVHGELSQGVMDPLNALMALRDMKPNKEACELGDTSGNVNLCTTISTYIEKCVNRALETQVDTLDMSAFNNADPGNTWAELKIVNPNWFTVVNFNPALPAGEIVTCQDAHTEITTKMNGGLFTTALTTLAKTQEADLDLVAKSMANHFVNNVMTGTPQTQAYDLAKAGFVKYLTLKGRANAEMATVADIAVYQALQQRHFQMGSNRSMWMEMARPLATFFEAFAIFLTPVMAIMMIVGGNSVTSAITYMGMLLWVSLWPVILTLINFYTDFMVRSAFEGAINDGVSIFNQGSIETTYTTIESYLSTSSTLVPLVPSLALFVIYRGVHTMLSAAGKAAPSTNIDSKLISPDIASAANAGRYQQGAHSGGLDSSGRMNHDYQQGNHLGFQKMNTGQTASNSATQMVSAAESKVGTQASVNAKSMERLFGEGGGLDFNTLSSSGVSSNNATTEQAINSIAESVGKSSGLSETESRNATLAAAAKVGLDIKGLASVGGSGQVSEDFRDALKQEVSASNGKTSNLSEAVGATLSNLENYSISGSEKSSEQFAKSEKEAFSSSQQLSLARTELAQAQTSQASVDAISKGMDIGSQPLMNSLVGANERSGGGLFDTQNDGGVFTGGTSLLNGQNVSDTHAQIFGDKAGAGLDDAGKADQIGNYMQDKYTEGLQNNKGEVPAVREALAMQNVVQALDQSFAGAQHGENRAEVGKGFKMSGEMFDQIADISRNAPGGAGRDFNADEMASKYKAMADASVANGTAESVDIKPVKAPVGTSGLDASDPKALKNSTVGDGSRAKALQEQGTGQGQDLIDGGKDRVNAAHADGQSSVKEHPQNQTQMAESLGISPEQQDELNQQPTPPPGLGMISEGLGIVSDEFKPSSLEQAAKFASENGLTQAQGVGLTHLLGDDNNIIGAGLANGFSEGATEDARNGATAILAALALPQETLDNFSKSSNFQNNIESARATAANLAANPETNTAYNDALLRNQLAEDAGLGGNLNSGDADRMFDALENGDSVVGKAKTILQGANPAIEAAYNKLFGDDAPAGTSNIYDNAQTENTGNSSDASAHRAVVNAVISDQKTPAAGIDNNDAELNMWEKAVTSLPFPDMDAATLQQMKTLDRNQDTAGENFAKAIIATDMSAEDTASRLMEHANLDGGNEFTLSDFGNSIFEDLESTSSNLRDRGFTAEADKIDAVLDATNPTGNYTGKSEGSNLPSDVSPENAPIVNGENTTVPGDQAANLGDQHSEITGEDTVKQEFDADANNTDQNVQENVSANPVKSEGGDLSSDVTPVNDLMVLGNGGDVTVFGDGSDATVWGPGGDPLSLINEPSAPSERPRHSFVSTPIELKEPGGDSSGGRNA